MNLPDTAPPPDRLRGGLEPLLRLRTTAVLGASDRWATAKLMRNLGRHGGRVLGVNPRRLEVGGVRCVPSLADLPERADVVAVALGTAAIVPAVEEALVAGYRSFVIPGLGAESADPAGLEARRRVTALLRQHDAACVGVNCMGLAVPEAPSAWIGTLPAGTRRGAVATLVHSGSIGEALVSMGPRVGLRCVVSLGTEASRDVADWLAHLADEEETRVVGVFLEAVRRPAALEAALARCAQAGTAVVALKVGRSEAAARQALAHTGAMVGSDRAFDALCRAYGVLRAADYPEWLETLEALGTGRRPAGPRLVVLSNSGGEAELVADLADDAGIGLRPLPGDLRAALDERFPFHGVGNPIDYWAVAPHEEILPATIDLCACHPDVDGVVLNVDQSWRFEGGERDGALMDVGFLADAVAATGTWCALLSTASSDPGDEVLARAAPAGVPVVIGGAAAVRAIANLVRCAPRPRPVAEPWDPLPAPEIGGRSGALPERDSKALLARYGIVGTREARAATAEEAVAAAEDLGYPVVVKRDGPAHKERDGGVVLGCATAEAVGTAARRLGPVLVAEELRGGVEVLCGLVRDPLHGPLVLCGPGGAWAEALAEQARAALAPLPHAEAVALVRDVQPLARRLDDAGVDAVARVLVALGRVAADHPAVREIDVNPLRVADGAGVALDALVVLEEGGA